MCTTSSKITQLFSAILGTSNLISILFFIFVHNFFYNKHTYADIYLDLYMCYTALIFKEYPFVLTINYFPL